MPLVFGSREVTVGPTVAYQGDDTGAPAYVREGQQEKEGVVIKGLSCISAYLAQGKEREGELMERGGLCLDGSDSAESSSIGGGGESSCESTVDDDREVEHEVQSKFKGGLVSMESLEESLPIKRGLSNFFSGKSKSFASLSDVASVKDLAKPDNPFNKRRRTLVASKSAWSSRRTFCSPLNTSMPLLCPEFSLEEEEEEEEEKEHEDSSLPPLPLQGRKFKTFKSPRSFSLTDLTDA
ncbi:uncharacterized protein LOC143851458 [Tasmannia lanceolata]|uniref:uncharacterized protein LOC143851458 n=1 Tax=Tasmannia lanceolata TaxID=3420 RepID=UPI004063E73D